MLLCVFGVVRRSVRWFVRPLLHPGRMYAAAPPTPTKTAASSAQAVSTPQGPLPPPRDVRFIRNIGVIAHIDAGKTTTSERFLFYSGAIQAIGNVDDGTTELDYLEVGLWNVCEEI